MALIKTIPENPITGLVSSLIYSGSSGLIPAVTAPNGSDLTTQALFISQIPTLDGLIIDERTGLDFDRAVQPHRAYDFDGSDDYITTPVDMTNSATLSIFARVKPENIAATVKIADQSDGANGFSFSITSTGLIQLFFYKGSTLQTVASAGTISAGAWASVAVTLSSTEAKFYINGVLDVTRAVTSPAVIDADTTNMAIGARNDNNDQLFDGILSNLCGYTTTLTDANILSLHNNVYPTGAEFIYKCDDTNSTVAYDSSGNANHGTKTNITPASFHYEGVDVPYSWQNKAGYTFDVSNGYVPRNESAIANDVLGAALQYTGSTPENGQALNSACGTFDGTNDYVVMATDTIGTMVVSMKFRFNGFTPTANDLRLWSSFETAGSTRTFGTTGWDFVSLTGGWYVSLLTSFFQADTDYHMVCKTVQNGSDVDCNLYINGDLKTTKTFVGKTLNHSGTYFRLARFNSIYAAVSMQDVRVYSADKTLAEVNAYNEDDLIFWLPMSENSGATVYDVSGNEYDGTVINATTTTGAGFWAQTQDVFHYSLGKGFTASSGVEIPALMDGTLDAAGNAITNPSMIGHNKGITDVQLIDEEWSYNDTRVNPYFKRTTPTGADRFLSYLETLSGSNYDAVRNYVQTSVQRVSAPAQSNLIIDYDWGDLDTTTRTLNDISKDLAALTLVTNKASPGTYDAAPTAGNISVSARVNNHYAVRNHANSALDTGFFAGGSGFKFTLGTVTRLPNLTSKTFFGSSDSSGVRRFFAEVRAAGTITFGVGSLAFTTAQTYAEGDILTIRMSGDESNFNAWINNVQVATNESYSFGTASTDTMLLLARTSGGSGVNYYSKGDLGVFKLYDKVLDATEMADLEAHLVDKSADNFKIRVLPLLGQSNIVGKDNGTVDYTSTTLEKPDARILQVVTTLNPVPANSAEDGDIIGAFEPLMHKDRTFGAVGMGFRIAKEYLDRVGRDPYVRVCLVPVAVGDTGFDDGSWVVTTGDLYLNAIDKTNIAMASATDAELVNFVWQQVAHDFAAGVTQSEYETYWDDMAAGLRSAITGASSALFVVGERASESTNGSGGPGIANATVASRDANAIYVDYPVYSLIDGVHWDVDGVRAASTVNADAAFDRLNVSVY